MAHEHALDALEPPLADVWKRIIEARGDATLIGVEEEHALATISLAISAKRSADALGTIAERLDHLTDYFDSDKAQLRVGANCDMRHVG